MMPPGNSRRNLFFILFLGIERRHQVSCFIPAPPVRKSAGSIQLRLSSLSNYFNEPKPPIPSTLISVSKQSQRSRNGRISISKSSTSNEEVSISKPIVTDDSIISASIAVGVITAAMGFLYGRVLNISVQTIWKKFPQFLGNKLGSNVNPFYFTTGTCALGGLVIGIVSLLFKNANFAVSDFVSSLSSTPTQSLPSSRINLFPLLLLSLLTSTFGFSLGPEAPMVCAGGLIGSSVARYWFQTNNETSSPQYQEILAYAGAAGALTASMGIPLAGSIFALEMTRSNAALSKAGDSALSPSVVASVAALMMLCYGLNPGKLIGGHFNYGSVGVVSGRVMMGTAVLFGTGGAIVGTVFHKIVKGLKHIAWSSNTNPNETNKSNAWKKTLAVKTTIGLLVGIISSFFPQTLFWGEGSLQCMIDGQKTPFHATHLGLPESFTTLAHINPSIPLSIMTNPTTASLQIGLAKLLSICLACAGKFPGGIIFPLFYAAAPLAHGVTSYLAKTIAPGIAQVTPVAVMCLMAATQASATRTPLATVLILSLTASGGTELSVFLPACVVSSYLGVFVSQILSRKSYFTYNDE